MPQQPINNIGILMAHDSYYLLKKEDVQGFLDALSSKMSVYAPVKSEGQFNFSKLGKKQKIGLEGYINTEFPPKGLLMPEGETLVKYEGSTICEVFSSEKRAIFGIRPCDVHAILVLDRVMLGHGDIEEHYEARRKNTLILAMNCTEAGENCFCGSLGTDTLTEGFDLLFTDEGSHYHVEVGSAEGGRLIKASANLFSATSRKAKRPKLVFKKHIQTEGLEDAMKRAAKSSIWEKTAERCLSCGSCTAACPTCYCFSLPHHVDITKMDRGKITREADYCMLLRFSRVAGNNVFREHRADRLKQFFYHKLVYGKENEGKMHCVGCGRCITECMAHIDITEEAAKVMRKYGKR